jgi:PAS domain S-box-containing protein
MCSILLMEPDGQHLRVGAAKSLPDAYNEACKHGIPVGDFQGSCGTAAYRRQAVIVADIETDPLWDVPPRPMVIAMGLRACWSMPILDDDGGVLGTVAMYYNERREPLGRDWGLLEPAARLIRLALAQQRRKDELRQAELMKREAAVLEVKRISLLSDMSQEILIIARNGIIVQVNAAGVRMLEGSGAPLIGRTMLELVSPAEHPALLRRMSRRGAALDREEIHLIGAGHTLVPVEFSCSTIDYEEQPATVFAFRDLTDRKRDEARIRHLAHHDALTNLPNRFLLNQRLTDALAEASKSNTTVSLLYLDLDNFKPVNDQLGHAAGDALLIRVAQRLQAELRTGTRSHGSGEMSLSSSLRSISPNMPPRSRGGLSTRCRSRSRSSPTGLRSEPRSASLFTRKTGTARKRCCMRPIRRCTVQSTINGEQSVSSSRPWMSTRRRVSGSNAISDTRSNLNKCSSTISPSSVA